MLTNQVQTSSPARHLDEACTHTTLFFEKTAVPHLFCLEIRLEERHNNSKDSVLRATFKISMTAFEEINITSSVLVLFVFATAVSFRCNITVILIVFMFFVRQQQATNSAASVPRWPVVLPKTNGPPPIVRRRKCSDTRQHVAAMLVARLARIVVVAVAVMSCQDYDAQLYL